MDDGIDVVSSDLTLVDVRLEGYGTYLVRADASSSLRIHRGELVDPLFDLTAGVFLFNSEASLARFYQDPLRYAEGVKNVELAGGR